MIGRDCERKMSERKFSRGLGKPGMAAQLRETVSQVVRESTVQVGGRAALLRSPHTRPIIIKPFVACAPLLSFIEQAVSRRASGF